MPFEEPVIAADFRAHSQSCRSHFSEIFPPKISARSVSVFSKILRSVGGGRGDAKKGDIIVQRFASRSDERLAPMLLRLPTSPAPAERRPVHDPKNRPSRHLQS